MNHKIRHYSKGLTLIEIAIGLIIFSICLGGVFSLLKHTQSAQQNTTTNNNRNIIVKTLNRFHQQNGRIPCPSPPGSNEGFELPRCQGPLQQIGIIPYKTLGIPENLAKDGYGNYFTYAVSEQSTFILSKLDITTTLNSLKILDISNRAYAEGELGIAYVLISHGPKGSGAFTPMPDRNRYPTHTHFDEENAKETLTFYADIPKKDSENQVFFIQRDDLDTNEAPEPKKIAIPSTLEDNPYATPPSADL